MALLLGCKEEKSAGFSEFSRKCKADGGVKIFRTIETSNFMQGIGSGCNWECISGLLRYNYEFVEANIDNNIPVSSLPLFFVKDYGLHRFEVRRRDSPECDLFKRIFNVDRMAKDHPGIDGKNCVVGKRIESAQSKYEAVLFSSDEYYKNQNLHLTKYIFRAKSNGEVFAQNFVYELNTKTERGEHTLICPENSSLSVTEVFLRRKARPE